MVAGLLHIDYPNKPFFARMGAILL